MFKGMVNLTDKLRELRQQLMAGTDMVHTLNATALSKREQKVLAHFWHRRWKDTRDGLTRAEIVFLEREAMKPPGARSALAADLVLPLASLVKKGYLTLTPGGPDPVYSLGALGERHMAREHPDLVANLQKLWDWMKRHPLYALVGLISSLLTIAGAIRWPG